MRTSNPALTPQAFSGLQYVADRSEQMTISGVVNKTLILLLCVLLTAGWTWVQYFKTGNAAAITAYMWVGLIGGLVVAITTIVKKEWSPITAPIYALLEGLFIGAISAIFEAAYPGLVIQATTLTFGTLGAMLFLYKSGIIQVTDKFRLGIVAATGGIAIFYGISIILGFFGVNIPYVFTSSAFGIAFSLFVVAIAALNLVLDFDFVEQGTTHGLPKYMEWYASFGLMVTLIWLYIEMLRLLAKLRDR